ncbi:MAG: carboxypeptidase regulatory-like domain-containing protein [Acidobacteria bacterium]|nr:carboxypeptidase regulatory-like domain-containing protein [Acidobacteriota bacterium]
MRIRLFDFKLGLSLAATLFALLLLPAVTHAQITRGSIAGTVRDESGAVVPGAEVKVIATGTNNTRSVTTDDSGFYRVGALDPATYTVVVERAGFSKVENREVLVNASLETTFDAQLKVGNVTESVDVTAVSEGITLNKTNATLGLSVPGKQITEFPLSAGRDVNQIALLSPNAVPAPGSTGISVNGQRARNNNFTIDGTDNNDISVTLSTVSIIPEAVAEFQVQTNAYSVEFGRNSGAQINVITRSGTNDFHGDLFHYYRGSRLNALDNVEKRNGQTRPSRFVRNQFGFVVGGPLHLPRFGEGGRSIISGKDRTFFFVAFQEDLQRSGGALGATIRIPTQAGFAALSTVPLRAGQSAGSRQAVLNSLSFLNQVYAQNPVFTSINTTAAIINGVPIQTGNVQIGRVSPTDGFNYLMRFDHQISENDNLTFRYTREAGYSANVTSNTQFGDIFAGTQNVVDQNMALSETHVFGPNVINEFRGSYVRRNLSFPENDPVTPTTTITGFFTVGGASNFPQGRIQNSYQISDTLSVLRGRNSLKFGADIRHIHLFNQAAFNTKGTFAFSNLAAFVNNVGTSFEQALQVSSFDARQYQQSYFVQDDIRLTPNFTLNLGLRYETANNPFGFFGATDAQSLGALVPGPAKRDNNNFAPAIGFNYSPRRTGDGFFDRLVGDGLTTLRGGYRKNYDVLFYNILTVNASNFPRVVTGRADNPVDVFPNIAPVTGAPVFNPLATFVNSPEDLKTPESHIYSLIVQRELSRTYSLEFGYTGSTSRNQVNQLQANNATLTEAQAALVRSTGNTLSIPSVQARREFPQFGSRVLIASTAKANFNAGFVSFNRKSGSGGRLNNLQFGISYTYGRLMSNNDESLGVGAITAGSPQVPQDFKNIDAEWSISAFDRTHRVVSNYVFEFPTPNFAESNGFLRRVFGGWQISGITSGTSGQPFSILTGTDTNGNGAGGDRPNVNPDAPLIPDPVTGNLRTFTAPGRFLVPRNASGAILNFSMANGGGNLGKNTLRAPAFWNTNLGLQKRFYIDEIRRFTIRADFLNAFNQDNYGIPVNNLSSASFGQNLNNFGNRSITVGGKFTF